jgi:alpha-L-rhamnosidase
MVGIYEEVWDTLLGPWRKMISEGLTTWAESESMVRSDCHGWSSTPMYEIVREVVGIKPVPGELGYGCRATRVARMISTVKTLQGTFVIGDGDTIEIGWDESGMVKIKCSKDMELEVVLNSTRTTATLKKGVQLISNRVL